MPAWFMDIESATEAAAKSNATPPAARLAHRVAGLARKFTEQRVARRHAAIGRGDADERFLQIVIGKPERAQERAVRRAVEPLNRDARAKFLRTHERFRRCPCCSES